LDLSSNLIESLPSNLFEHNPQLEFINFAYNRLKSIGVSTFSNFHQLKTVDLTGNFLCTNFNNFTKEELTMFATNKIKRPCKMFDGLDSCDFINDDFSYVGTASACVTKRMNLTTFNFDREILGFDGSPAPVEVLFVRKQTCLFLPRIHSIHIKAIHIISSKLHTLTFYYSKVTNLRSLVLTDNEITQLSFLTFFDTPNLIHIDLRGNPLLSIESSGVVASHIPIKTLLLETNAQGEMTEGLVDFKRDLMNSYEVFSFFP
jgi:hypothetical protein